MAGYLAREHQAGEFCEHCGQPLLHDFSKTGVQLRDNEILFKNQHVLLTNREFSIIKTLLSGWPATVARERIMNKVWNVAVEEKILEVYVCKLRKKLKPVGLAIETIWGSGYRFVVL